MRELSAALVAAIESRNIYHATLFECVFPSLTLRLWDGRGPLVWDGKTWLGNGWLLSTPGVNENDRLVAQGVSVQLSGVPQELASIVLSESRLTVQGKIYLAFLDNDNGEVVDVLNQFSGHLESPEFNDTANTASLTLNFENNLIMLKEDREFVYSHESQHALYGGGDRGFEHMKYIPRWSGYWGHKLID